MARVAQEALLVAMHGDALVLEAADVLVERQLLLHRAHRRRRCRRRVDRAATARACSRSISMIRGLQVAVPLRAASFCACSQMMARVAPKPTASK